MDEVTQNRIKNYNPIENIEWKTNEYEHLERHSDWFWLVGLIGFLTVILAVVTLNFLFAIIVIIGTFSIMMYGARKPDLITILISRRGIKVGENFYPYKNISAFALRDDEKPYKLIIHVNRLFLPHVSIQLENTDSKQIRKYLSQFSTEEPYEEPFLEIIAERLGF